MDDLDHRSLGTRLDLWHIQEDAPGMVFWHPRGHVLYRVLEDHIRRRMRGLGYAEVRTPQLLPRELWERSGHWEKFGDGMFPVASARDGGRQMALKPMSCPCHVQIFNRRLRSWRDLPVRYAEFGACHRDEPSGALHGLMRTRGFEQDDAHVFCSEEHVEGEVARFISLLAEVYAELGFDTAELALSTRPAARSGSDDLWDWAERTLGQAAGRCGLDYDLQPGEGAFYGPKLEFALRDRRGRSWQCGTVQLDCVLPGRLDAFFIGPDGNRAVPLMIHHAVFGSLGRLVAVLLEHHGPALPFWLSPEQVAVAAVSRDQAEFASEVREALVDASVRAVVHDEAATLSRRIVAAHDRGIPVMAIVGGKEKAARTVTLRERGDASTSALLASVVAQLRERAGPPRNAGRVAIRRRHPKERAPT